MPVDSPTRVAENNPLTAFQWERQPQAEQFVRGVVDDFLNRTPYAANLARRMKEETGTRFFDWVETITLAPGMQPLAIAAGFMPVESDIPGVFAHPGGMFPTLIIDGTSPSRGTPGEGGGEGRDGCNGKDPHPSLLPEYRAREQESHPRNIDRLHRFDLTIRVECVADFATAQGLPLLTADEPLSQYRRTLIARGDGTEFWAAERHGFRGFLHPQMDAQTRIKRIHHLENFRTRRRDFETDIEGVRHDNDLLDAAIRDLGINLACDLFFYAEREFWQRRNRAAQVQKARQDRLGLGWANHDHHTYRSSRENFSRMIATFEKLGFHCRERFYAGAQAGWGAQVLEQPDARIVIFADVDLAPEELLADFSHEGLPPRDTLGTVGLWCALHGEAFLQAGMHHLECQFDFDALRDQMESAAGVKVMKPFTNFPFLRQAFTEGEVWQVRPERIARLLAAGKITEAQAAHFRQHGAIGSHLENLERNEGFKGFNQTGVSDIIQRTDPRAEIRIPNPRIPE
jgi:hypothetical protein